MDNINVVKETALAVEKKPPVLVLPYLGSISLQTRTKLKKSIILQTRTKLKNSLKPVAWWQGQPEGNALPPAKLFSGGAKLMDSEKKI